MNLLKIIPNNNKWVVSKNIVYINYLAKIPILVKSGDDVWVYLDNVIAKYVIQLVKILEENKIDFLFKSTLIFFDHKFTIDEFHNKNLSQYIHNITNPKFYDGFEKINFDYTNNLAKYLNKYECYEVFQSVYQAKSKYLLTKEYDYYTNKSFDRIRRDDIRDYIKSLQRDIKISMLF